jgi:hypothetical protein
MNSRNSNYEITVRDQLLRLGYRVFDLDANHIGAEVRQA